MSEFITKNQLELTAKNGDKSKDLDITNIIERFEMHLSKSTNNELDISVFISHSHKDKELIKYLFNILRNLKVKVYVDWLDDELTYPPTSKTAEKIKKMIKTNKKFILLATNDAIASKWCNWELGLGDAHKFIDHIALLPVSEDSGDWKGNEYLQIYPYIEKVYKSLEWDKTFNIVYPDKRKIDMLKWLKK
jgi:hypothetical protein